MWIQDRPDGYNPAYIYNWETLSWEDNVSVLIYGGGRYQKSLIAISWNDNDLGTILIGGI